MRFDNFLPPGARISGRCANFGGGFAQCFVNQNLFVRVRQMILPANNVGDFHFDVVADDRQIIQRMPVGTQQNKVFDFVVIAFLRAVNRVFKTRFADFANFQTNRKRLAGLRRVYRILLLINHGIRCRALISRPDFGGRGLRLPV